MGQGRVSQISLGKTLILFILMLPSILIYHSSEIWWCDSHFVHGVILAEDTVMYTNKIVAHKNLLFVSRKGKITHLILFWWHTDSCLLWGHTQTLCMGTALQKTQQKQALKRNTKKKIHPLNRLVPWLHPDLSVCFVSWTLWIENHNHAESNVNPLEWKQKVQFVIWCRWKKLLIRSPTVFSATIWDRE